MSLEMENRYPNISLFTDFFSNFLKYYSEVNYAKKNLLFPLDKIFFEKFKSRFNEVLFILGTGESINLITKKQWAFIDSNRTIGINQWFVHEYIPNFLICEGFETMNDVQISRSGEIRGCYIILIQILMSLY